MRDRTKEYELACKGLERLLACRAVVMTLGTVYHQQNAHQENSALSLENYADSIFELLNEVTVKLEQMMSLIHCDVPCLKRHHDPKAN